MEDVRELLSSGDDVAYAADIASTSPPKQLDGFPEDDTVIDHQDAASSEMFAVTDQFTPTNERSLDTEAVASSETAIVVNEATEPDNDVAIMGTVSAGAGKTLMNHDAESAADVTIPSPCRHEEAVKADAAITTKGASTPSSDAINSPIVPEASSIEKAAGVALSATKNTPNALAKAKVVSKHPSLDWSLTPSVNTKTPQRTSPRKKATVTTPGASSTAELLLSAESLRPDYLGETPQIGTSLLRRESLRRKESPSKKRDARKNKTPKKRDTLQRRDTLQEREILQKVIAENELDHSDENPNLPPIEPCTLLSSSSVPAAEDDIADNTHGSSEPFICEEQSDWGTTSDAESVLPVIDETKIEKDLHRAMEAIEVYEHPGTASQPLLDVTLGDTRGIEAMDKANEVLARTELDDVSQATQSIKEQTPNQKKRSGARFSDDTSMLKDFLNRAQARKAAQKPVLSAPEAAISQHSPRRSPRKMHGSQDGRGSSPEKPRNIASRPNTPPSKPKLEAFDSDDGEEHTAEPASCRRSTRTRLPAPSKTVPGAPSFIPVRRADGTDPVVLQKSQAQELAVATRANTRRNKGQSKPPLLALQDLPTETTDLAISGKRGAEKAKSVAWAERLASYRDANGEADEVEERRPKVRRLRGLGAVNGTPAAKRTTAVVSSTNGTPAPKGRGKV